MCDRALALDVPFVRVRSWRLSESVASLGCRTPVTVQHRWQMRYSPVPCRGRRLFLQLGVWEAAREPAVILMASSSRCLQCSPCFDPAAVPSGAFTHTFVPHSWPSRCFSCKPLRIQFSKQSDYRQGVTPHSSVWTWGRTSSLWGWRSPGPGCPGRLWSLLLWRYSRLTWTRSCAACCRWPCFGRRVGLDDPQWSLPTPTTILWSFLLSLGMLGLRGSPHGLAAGRYLA